MRQTSLTASHSRPAYYKSTKQVKKTNESDSTFKGNS